MASAGALFGLAERGLHIIRDEPKKMEKERAFCRAILLNQLQPNVAHTEDRAVIQGLPQNGRDRCMKIIILQVIKSDSLPSENNMPQELHPFVPQS